MLSLPLLSSYLQSNYFNESQSFKRMTLAFLLPFYLAQVHIKLRNALIVNVFRCVLFIVKKSQMLISQTLRTD